MREFLLSISSPELLSGIGFVISALSLLGGVAVLVVPTHKHAMHNLLGLLFAAGVVIGYLVSHIGDDESFRIVSERAKTAESALAKLTAPRTILTDHVAEMMKILRQYPARSFWIIIEKAEVDVATEQQALAS